MALRFRIPFCFRRDVRAARSGDAVAACRCATVAVLAAGLLLAPLLWKPWIHGTDGARNFAYVRSLVIDGDLNFTDEFEHLAALGEYGGDLTPDPVTGRPGTPVGIGSAVLWMPFYLAAHGAARAGLARTDGYSWPYVWAVCLASMLYALAGLAFLVRMAARRFGAWAALVGVAAAWLGSPLVFYMYPHPSMSHGCSFFLWVVLVRLCEWRPGRGRAAYYALLGAVCGLVSATRFVDAVCVLLPAAVWWGRLSGPPASAPGLQGDSPGGTREASPVSLPNAGTGSRRLENLHHLWRWPGAGDWACVAAAVAGFGVGFLPQMAAWHALHGSWLAGPRDRQVGLTAQLTLATSPHLWQVLFSGWRGLFVWSPVLVAGAWGWTRLALRRGGAAADRAYGVAFLAQLWVVGGWAQWHGGASFGQRFFIDCVPGFALGLAYLFSQTRSRAVRRWLAAGAAACLLWSGGLAVQYAAGVIPRTEPVSIAELARNQVVAVPRVLAGILRHAPRGRGEGHGAP